ncbi:MAG: ABC transporter permease [Sedimentisphaerales bacterium]|nr:ABC transporter permease [Sedimentisphaerales bacterium]
MINIKYRIINEGKMSNLISDIRYGFRKLSKKPGFFVVAVITLAIGIGANTTTFSLLNILFLRPLHVDRIEELAICEAENVDFFFNYAPYQALRENNPVFTDLAAVSVMTVDVTFTRTDRAGFAGTTPAYCVSSNYFSVLGSVPAQGRWFLPEEEQYTAEPVVVLSYEAWKKHFEKSDVVGSQILLNDIAFRIVGVAPKGFTGVTMFGTDFWLPLGKYALFMPSRWREGRGPEPYPNVIPVGRLKPQLDLAAAQAQVQAAVPGLRANYPQWWSGTGQLKLLRPGRMNLIPYFEQQQRSSASVLTVCLMSVSGVVLVIACLNLAGMMVVQGASRQREIAIRLSLGGGRFRIVQQLLIECLLLSLVGGVFGYILASVGLRTVHEWIGAQFFPINVSRSLLDVRVLSGSLGFCIVATLLFGLKPALRLSRRDVVTDLKESGRDANRSSNRKQWAPRGLSVVVQTALSFVLVMGAALFTRSAFNALYANSNFDFDGKLLMQVDLSTSGYDLQHTRQVYQTIKERFLALPGVESVAFSLSSHFTQTKWNSGPVSEFAPSSEQKTPRIKLTQGSLQYNVGVDYFETLGIPLLQGRPFNELDSQADTEKVVVINETLARILRPDGNALDRYIQWGPDKYIDRISPHRVVGIVADLASGNTAKTEPTLYVVTHEESRPRFIHVRTCNMTRKGQQALLGTLSQEMFNIDAQIPVTSVSSLLDRSRQTEEVLLSGLGARLAICFGGIALFLAALGIYAIKGYMVASRTPEIGIRMTLGATRREIILMVFCEGGRLMLIGLGLGIIMGLVLARLMQSMFYNVSAVDPVSIVVTISVLVLTSLLSGLIPALRAAKIDPMEALRYE